MQERHLEKDFFKYVRAVIIELKQSIQRTYYENHKVFLNKPIDLIILVYKILVVQQMYRVCQTSNVVKYQNNTLRKPERSVKIVTTYSDMWLGLLVCFCSYFLNVFIE